jgi:tetratricopeptide (TPR) repeat protein
MVRLRPSLSQLAWLLLFASIGDGVCSVWQWQRAARIDRMIADGTLIDQPKIPDAPAVRYAAGWLYQQVEQNQLALQRYADAETAEDPRVASRAKFALGNLYLQIGLRAGDVASGGSHVRGLAQLELAREAYRDALRLDPDLRDARYNLELLERLSPDKRNEGWSSVERNHKQGNATDPGWASMQENTIRGLP